MSVSSTTTKLKTSEIVKKFGKSAQDTGSAEVQVALLTDRINHLTDHLKKFMKDEHTRRGLLKMVGQRKRVLSYLRGRDDQRYAKLIDSLGLRK